MLLNTNFQTYAESQGNKSERSLSQEGPQIFVLIYIKKTKQKNKTFTILKFCIRHKYKFSLKPELQEQDIRSYSTLFHYSFALQENHLRFNHLRSIIFICVLAPERYLLTLTSLRTRILVCFLKSMVKIFFVFFYFRGINRMEKHLEDPSLHASASSITNKQLKCTAAAARTRF